MKTYGIEKHNILNPKNIYRNLEPAVLTEMALRTEECALTDTGALKVDTGKYTGRSPKDRYIVDEAGARRTRRFRPSSLRRSTAKCART